MRRFLRRVRWAAEDVYDYIAWMWEQRRLRKQYEQRYGKGDYEPPRW